MFCECFRLHLAKQISILEPWMKRTLRIELCSGHSSADLAKKCLTRRRIYRLGIGRRGGHWPKNIGDKQVPRDRVHVPLRSVLGRPLLFAE